MADGGPEVCLLCGVALCLVGGSSASVCGDCLINEAHINPVPSPAPAPATKGNNPGGIGLAPA